MINFVPGMGNSDAKLMFVGEAPGRHENEKQKPFCGAAGDMLDDILRDCGISRNQVWLTNVYKYKPPDSSWKNNDISRIKEVLPESPEEHLAKYLYKEIEEINPNCIVAMGNTALKALCGHSDIKKYRGSILVSHVMGKKVVPTYHPAAYLYGEEDGGVHYSMRYVSQSDILRAYEESLTSDINLPQPHIQIVRDSADVWKFFNSYKAETHLSVDIEVIKAIPVSIGLAFNQHNALVYPLISLHRLQEDWYIPHAELALMQKLTIEAYNDYKLTIIGQNFKFDQVKLEDTLSWKRWLRRDIPILDTAILAHCLHPEFPKNLAFLTSIYTRQPFYKDEGKEFDYRRHGFKRFFTYNGLDAVVQYEVAFALLKEIEVIDAEIARIYPNWKKRFVEGYISKLHYFYKDMEAVGLLVDKDIRRKYISQYTQLYKESRARLNEVAGFECNPHSPKDVPLLLYRELRLPSRKDCSRQTLVALLNNTAKQPRQKEAINLILRSRRLRKAKTTYYEAALDYDGRMRTSWNINGTENGRTSTNILKPPIRPDKMGIAFQTMTKHGDIGHELREIFIPDPGYCFVEIDLSQAEARVVALLAKDYELLEKFEKGVDVHSETFSYINGVKWDGKRVSKENRFIGKKGSHAYNYDIGKRELMQQFNAEAEKLGLSIRISEYRAGEILKALDRLRGKTIKGIFQQEIQERLMNDRYLINPFGRLRKFYGRFDRDMFKEGYACLPQGTVIDHFRYACFRAQPRLDSKGYKWCLESHDAVVGLVLIDYLKDYARIMKEEINKEIDFSECSLPRGKLRIPCDIQVGYKNLKELEEYHVDI